MLYFISMCTSIYKHGVLATQRVMMARPYTISALLFMYVYLLFILLLLLFVLLGSSYMYI